MALEFDRWLWQELFASEHGPKDPGTRHVLHVLVMHVNDKTGIAFPGQSRISRYTGLSERSVRTHLAIAAKKGWLKIRPVKRREKHGFWNKYHMAIPARLSKLVTYSRPETAAGRKNPRPETAASRPAINDITTGNLRLHDRKPLPLNHVFNQSSNQVLNSEQVWEALIGSKGKKRDSVTQQVLDQIGGWSRIQMRTEFESPKIKREFCDAYRQISQSNGSTH